MGVLIWTGEIGPTQLRGPALPRRTTDWTSSATSEPRHDTAWPVRLDSASDLPTKPNSASSAPGSAASPPARRWATAASPTPASRPATTSVATGTSATRTGARPPTARCTSTPVATASRFRDMPMGTDDYPDYPHHEQIKRLPRQLRRRLRPARPDPRSRPRSSRAERRATDGRLDDHARATAPSREFDFLVVGNGHHWDPRYPDFPGELRPGETLHSHHYLAPTEPLDLLGKRVLVVGIGNSAVDIVSELSRKGVAEQVFISTRSGAWVMPKYLFGQPVGELVKTNPHICRSSCSAGWPGPSPTSPRGAWRTSGCPSPTTTSSRRIRPSPASCCCASAPATRWRSRTSPSCWATRSRFEDGTVEEVDAIIYATGYKITFPFFDERVLSAPGNKLPLYKRIFKPGDRRPRADRVRAGHPHPLPVHRAAEQAGRPLRGRGLGAPHAGRDGGDDRRRTTAAERRLRGPSAPHHADRLVPLRARHPQARDARGPGAGAQRDGDHLAGRAAPPASDGARNVA